LDSEQEGDIYVGCAGGVDGKFSMQYALEDIPSEYISLKIIVKGLRGGHSGLDINLGRGNANKILARIIVETESVQKILLQSFNGGNLRNAIPREATAEISISKKLKNNIITKIEDSFKNIKNEFSIIEPNLKLEFIESNNLNSIVQGEWLLNTILSCPHGVIAMSPDIKDLTETSTNLAIVKTQNHSDKLGLIKIESFMRSSSDSALEALTRSHKSLFSIAGFQVEFGNSYSGWKPNMESPILKLATKVFIEMYHKDPSIKAIHAGLETGYFTKHFPNMDMVSIGPTIKFPHSPDEKVEIASVKTFWDYLIKILSEF
jgi:dipeptidase D